MPRTSPSPAEDELAAAVSARCKRVTPRQLERWRGWELLHPLPRRALGRGRGSESYVTEELIEEAGVVAEVMAEARARPLAALTLFARGRYVTEPAVRAAYREVFDFVLSELEAEERPEDESMFDTLDRYARKLSRRSAGSSAMRARERLRTAGAGARLADVNFLNLVLTLTGRVPNPRGLETLAVAMGIDAMTRESLSGAGPAVEDLNLEGIQEQIAQLDVHTLLRLADEVSWDELCASRDFVAGLTELARAMLVPAEHQGAPEALGLREFALQSDWMIAVAALALVPLMSNMREAIATWTALSLAQTPVYRAFTSWLEGLPDDLRSRLPRIEDGFTERLDPATHDEVVESMRAWTEAHPEEAEALFAAAEES
jgi:hypothetical protein